MQSLLLSAEAQALVDERLAELGASLVKIAGDAVTVQLLSGSLYSTEKGWVMLSVPNALVRGTFDALHAIGAELPYNKEGKLNAHISVMTPEELEKIGGKDKISELGHSFRYSLGPVQEVNPEGYRDFAKCWFIRIHSKELQDLRKSYGLSPKPHNGERDFHITFAVRRKGVLSANSENVKQSSKKVGGFLDFVNNHKTDMLDGAMGLSQFMQRNFGPKPTAPPAPATATTPKPPPRIPGQLWSGSPGVKISSLSQFFKR